MQWCNFKLKIIQNAFKKFPFQLDTALKRMYNYLQRFAVGLEVMVEDQAMYDGEFIMEFNEAEYKLKAVRPSCKKLVMLMIIAIMVGGSNIIWVRRNVRQARALATGAWDRSWPSALVQHPSPSLQKKRILLRSPPFSILETIYFIFKMHSPGWWVLKRYLQYFCVIFKKIRFVQNIICFWLFKFPQIIQFFWRKVFPGVGGGC